VVLGGVVFAALRGEPRSAIVLPAVLAACAADYSDGIVARRRGDASLAGRLVDNLCDAAFLALVFAAMGRARLFAWKAAGESALLDDALCWLPLAGLVLSFGSYLLRWGAAHGSGRVAERSAFGHRAGILNYALAVMGAVAVFPGAPVPSAVPALSSLAVSLFNVAAAFDNARLLARRA